MSPSGSSARTADLRGLPVIYDQRGGRPTRPREVRGEPARPGGVGVTTLSCTGRQVLQAASLAPIVHEKSGELLAYRSVGCAQEPSIDGPRLDLPCGVLSPSSAWSSGPTAGAN